MTKLNYDLGVIAAGPAGLCAAASAAEAGVSVVVFEKASTAGGTANMGMGPFGVESRIQQQNMISMTKEQAFERFMEYVHWHTDARLVREYFWKSGETINWQEDMGVPFYGAKRYSPVAEETWHIVQPEDGSQPGPRAASLMCKILYEYCVELGVKFLFETPADKILGDKDGVHGIHGRNLSTGEEVEAQCKAVIIATGGFAANPEMVKEHTGYQLGKDMLPICGPTVTGDGLRMAWEVGAGHGRMEMEGIIGSFLNWEKYPFEDLFKQANLIVNKSGFRICDESVMCNTGVANRIIDYQQDKTIWNILDDKLVKYYRRNGLTFPSMVVHNDPTENFDELAEAAAAELPGTVCVADSPEELAEKMGVNVENFLETLEEYNDACEANFDDYFCKPRKYLHAYKGKKWYALSQTCGAYGSLGGIKHNWKLEIITDDYKVIPGLYGAGNDVNEMYDGTYMFYLPGNTMGFAVNTGRMAGERAAEYIQNME